MENKDIPDMNKSASRDLYRRLARCAALSGAAATAGRNGESWEVRSSAVRMMARLARASAAAAVAMRQVEGIEIHHTVLVQRSAGREGHPLQPRKRIVPGEGGYPGYAKTNGAPQ